MRQRFLTGTILVAIFIPLLVLGGWYVLIGVMVFAGLGAYELANMFSLKGKPYTFIQKLGIAGLGAVYSNMLFLQYRGYLSMNDTIGMIMLSFVLILIVYIFNDELSIEHISHLTFILIYAGMGSGAIMVLRFMGFEELFYVALVAICVDTFAYLIGVNFGKHKIIPKISPKKSVEGSIGGSLVATAIGSWYLVFVDLSTEYAIPLWGIVIFTFLLTIIVQLGDFVASKMKREYQIKDFSNIFPGHGGMLDRFDSLLLGAMFTLGVVWFFL